MECSEYVNVEMYTATQSEGDWYLKTIAGNPVVKLLYVEHNASTSADFNATVNFYYTPYELRAMGARESGFSVYAWNGTAWGLLNTTWDSEGRVVSANTTHLSVFALVAAAEWSMWGLLGPFLLLNAISQAFSPLGGLMLPLIGIGATLIVAIALAALYLKKKP